MNETLQKLLERIRSYVSRMSPRQRNTASVVGALVGLTALGLFVLSKRDPNQVLYTDLGNEDSRAVVKKLGEQSIPYEASADGSTIMVPASHVANARMQLAKDGIPGQDVVGFEKFDGSTLGMSSYVQRIQYIRAVQGELIRSIQRLASVKHARLHISMPPKKTFLEEEDPPKASVVLELHAGQAPSKQETTGIAHLVASAVEGLKVSQVTIVDTQGNFLHRPEDSNVPGVSTALLEMQRSIESEYERRVQEILTPVVGLGKVRAKVTAEIDPSRVNTTEESFDPDKAAVRNNIRNEETTQGSKPNPIGIPGSRSNLPGAEAQNPATPMANTSSEKNTQNTSYAVPRKIQITDKPSGNIKRLTVAVVVDGHYTKNGTAETFSPLSDEEIKRLQDLVGNAVGLDIQRRDSITVSSLPFHPTELPPEEIPAPLSFWQNPDFKNRAIRDGFLILSALAIFFIAFKWLLRGNPPGNSAEMNLVPKTIAELEAQRNAEAMMALGKGGIGAGVGAGGANGRGANGVGGVNGSAGALGVGSGINGVLGMNGDGFDEEAAAAEKDQEANLRKQIIEILTASPKKGIRVVQDWLEEDKQQVTSDHSSETAKAVA